MSRGSSRDRDSMMREMESRGPPDVGSITGDKSARSVFVGNIPYEATEEKLKDIFSEVGAVISFKLVYDRENGKPRGYGFCEYQNPETANCAMRNLNGYEIGGRTLRVDSACTEKNRMNEVAGAGGGPGAMGGGGGGPGGGGGGPQHPPGPMPGGPGPSAVDNGPYGDTVEPGQAPEAISKAVASLPPEQMFELMKQMKMCIQNNPQEARNMLLQNPQLAYALLQGQVVMRIVEPEMALQMLHKNPQQPMGMAPPVNQRMGGPIQGMGGPPIGVGPLGAPMGGGGPMGGGPMGGDGGPPPFGGGGGPPPSNRPFDDRGPFNDGPPDQGGRFVGRDPRNRDPRGGGGDPRDMGRGDPRDRDPRGDPRDPRGGFGGRSRGGGASGSSGFPPAVPQSNDPAKNELIMQVLKLTDDQIKMLPMEQQRSIMELKKQLNSGN